MSDLHVLSVQSSGRVEGSVSRSLSTTLIKKLKPSVTMIHDLTHGVPFVDAEWMKANFTSVSERTAEQSSTLAYSDSLVEDLLAANIIVIGLPIYNFGVSASLKAWIDMVAHVGRTFRYTESGPVGLLTNKKAIIVVASGGTLSPLAVRRLEVK